MFKDNFKECALIGDSITCNIKDVTYTATLHHDRESRPEDSECYSESQIKRFYDDEWHYCGIVISAERNGWVKENLASLWGIELNLGDNSYLLEVANDLLEEAILEARK